MIPKAFKMVFVASSHEDVTKDITDERFKTEHFRESDGHVDINVGYRTRIYILSPLM